MTGIAPAWIDGKDRTGPSEKGEIFSVLGPYSKVLNQTSVYLAVTNERLSRPIRIHATYSPAILCRREVLPEEADSRYLVA